MRRSKKRFESSGRYDVATEHERIFHRVRVKSTDVRGTEHMLTFEILDGTLPDSDQK